MGVECKLVSYRGELGACDGRVLGMGRIQYPSHPLGLTHVVSFVLLIAGAHATNIRASIPASPRDIVGSLHKCASTVRALPVAAVVVNVAYSSRRTEAFGELQPLLKFRPTLWTPLPPQPLARVRIPMRPLNCSISRTLSTTARGCATTVSWKARTCATICTLLTAARPLAKTAVS